MGAIAGRQRRIAQRQERAVARLIRRRRWREAHKEREALLQYIQAGHYSPSPGFCCLHWHTSDMMKQLACA